MTVWVVMWWKDDTDMGEILSAIYADGNNAWAEVHRLQTAGLHANAERWMVQE